jgi:WD40 repeat protein
LAGLTFNPDGSDLAAASYDRRLDVWSTKTGEKLLPIPQPGRRAVLCVAFDPNGRLLASAGEDKTVHIRDAATGRELLALRGHSGAVTSLAFSPDGQRLVSASKDRSIRVWDATPLGDDERQEAQTLTHHNNEIWSLAVRPTDGRMVVSGGIGNPATVWDPHTGDVITSISGQEGAVFCVAWSPDGDRVASAGGSANAEFSLKIVNPLDRTQDRELPLAKSEYMAVAFHPNSKHLITGQQDGTIRIWDVRTRGELGQIGTHTQPMRGLAFSPDGRYLASVSVDGEIKLWDATRLDEQHLDGKSERRVAPMRARSPGMCLNLSFSPDGRFLASGAEEYTVKIWDVETGQEAHPPLRGHKEDIYAVVFSPDGRWLASAGEDSTIRVWDRHADYALVRTFRGHTGLVNSLAFSPDSRLLFSGSNDYTVKVWDVTQLKEQPRR